MVLSKVYTNIKELLLNNFTDRESEILAFQVIENSLDIDKIAYTLDPQRQLSEEALQKVEQVIERLLANEPLEYIYEKAVFLDYEFYVNKGVLIPRPETEELVELIKSHYDQAPNAILDIGTGSGCIPISLSLNWPSSNVQGWDISEQALAVAKRNNDFLDSKVKFIKKDAFEAWDLPQKFDIVISNPPYVLEQDKSLMKPNVLQYEPHLALFVPDHDPLKYYKVIAEKALDVLNPNGRLYFEIHESFGEQMKDLMQSYYNSVELILDLNNKPRMIYGVKS